MINKQQQLVVIDDEESIHHLVGRALKGTGWGVTCFLNEAKAIDHIAAGPPAVILVDVRMPRMHGDEVLDELASRGLLEGVRVLVSSSVRPPAPLWRKFEKHDAKFVNKDDVVSAESMLAYLDGH